MSIVAVMAVLDAAAPLTQPDFAVLVVLATFADESGGNCWPSKTTIAKKARASRRGVQKVLRRLERRGLVSVVARASRHNSTRYQLNLAALTRDEPRSPLDPVRGEPGSPLKASRRPSRGEPEDTLGANQRTVRGEPGSPDPSLTVLDPSIPPPAVHSPADDTNDDEPPFAVYRTFASEALQELAFNRQSGDLGAVSERVKQKCARAGIRYHAGKIQQATDAALVARDKAAAKLASLMRGHRGPRAMVGKGRP